jgi:PAS domain S-box-containing protein
MPVDFEREAAMTRHRSGRWRLGGAGIFILIILLVPRTGSAWQSGTPSPGEKRAISYESKSNPSAIELTPEEEAWIEEHPLLRLGVDPAWPPYEFVDAAGRYSGIAADYVALLRERLGIDMEVQPGLSWEQVLTRLENKELDVSPAITKTPERSRFLLFTQPHVKYSVAIVTQLAHPGVDGLAALAGKNVALVKGYAFTELALASQPDINPVYVDTILEGLNKVSNGEAEAIVSDLPSLSYKISEYNFLNLKVAGIAPFQTEGLRIGVRNDRPILASILEKALASITPEEHQQIRQRWVTARTAESVAIDLSPEEREWLANHPVIRNAADPAWAPIEFVDEQGRLRGITSEYLGRLEQMLHVRFETPWDMTWAQMMEALKDGRLDMASCVRNTPQRRSFMEFTEPYFSMPTVIFAHTDVAYVDLQSLKGKSVAVVEGYALQDLISDEHPEIHLVPVRNLKEGLSLLSKGDVHAYIDALAPGIYALTHDGFTNIHVAGEAPFRYEMSMAASAQQPILASILRKALKAVPEADRDRFFQKWATVPITYRVDYSLIWKTIAGAVAFVLIVVYWNRKLSREVAERSLVEAALREAKEELERRVEERTAELAARNAALAEEVLERRRAEEALRESEERFSRAFSLSPAPMVISEIDTGCFIDVNEQWLRMLELSREETIGRTSYEMGLWGDLEARTRLGRKLKEAGSFRDEPMRFITKSGVIKDALWSAEKVILGGSEVMLSLVYDFSERKRAEEALQAKTEELDRFFSLALDLLSIADTGGRFRRLNPQWQTVLGYPIAELEGRRFLDLVHPEDLEATIAAMTRLEAQESVLDFTNRYRCGDGTYRWIEWRSFPVGDLIYAAARDITERKRAEEALRESMQRLQTVVNGAPVVLYSFDRNGVFTLSEGKGLIGLGIKPGEIVGRTIFEIYGDQPEAIAALRRAMAGETFTLELSFSAGGTFEVSHIAIRDEAGDYNGTIGVLLDITERKRVEEALQLSEATYREIFNTVNDTLWIHDIETFGFLDVNRKVTEMFGYSVGEARGLTVEDVSSGIPPFTQETAAELLRKAAAGEPQLFEWHCRHKDGHLFWTEVNLRRGTIAGRECILSMERDITERKKAEGELRTSLEEKESLLKEVHHRVKNNLQVISSLLKLQARKVQSPEVLDFLRDTQNRIRSMALLHETLYRSGNLARVSLPQYVKNVCTHVARSYASGAAGIRLGHEIADVSLDVDLAIPVGLIINELVSNAFKHAFPSRSNGELLVELQSAPENQLVLRVSDNGVGLPAGADPQSAETLGLLLVRNLARQLDGRMSASRGQGTVFEIVFPAQPL